MNLFQIIGQKSAEWRDDSYPCEQYPAIAELLNYQRDAETGSRRFLRQAQIKALETYWYLRVVENTPHIFDLYRRYFPKKTELLAALGLTGDALRDYLLDYGFEALIERIQSDDSFVKDMKLEALRETLTLGYPSYILALAMGAGKTILIGAIIATEFAMAAEYPEDLFIQNALVFAPGKTIIESLRELAQVPYDRILPPRFYRSFAASVKLTFTRDGERDLPVIRGSVFNIVVTNTEKIRIQKETIRKTDLGQTTLSFIDEDQAKQDVANLRLQAVASLPNLAIFSDEAHHTYGQSMGTELKKVRQTVDYLYQNSPSLICVINTTGTPYFQRQPLKDVVIWYGLSEGIRDGVLKEVAGNIVAYEFKPAEAEQFVYDTITSFFADYADVRLPNGSYAKLAMYFPQNNDLAALRPIVEEALLSVGQSPALILRNTSESSQQEVDAFNRLNDPDALHRVILLVNKGTEGWNCPSLFACALVRKLKASNNFVLQAATRCLRQIPGNNQKARIYLSMDNRAILDKQLQETYGESIADLDHSGRETRTAIIWLRKRNIPPITITKTIRTFLPDQDWSAQPLCLVRPTGSGRQQMTKTVLTIGESQSTYQDRRCSVIGFRPCAGSVCSCSTAGE